MAVRERGPVGRRIWRRRKKKDGAPASGEGGAQRTRETPPDDDAAGGAPGDVNDLDDPDGLDGREDDDHAPTDDVDAPAVDLKALDRSLGLAPSPPAPVSTTATPAPGFFARLFGRKQPTAAAPSSRSSSSRASSSRVASASSGSDLDDPVRELLVLPRGIARLDAFQHRLDALTAGSPAHRQVAVAFARELTSMAREAGLDLSVVEHRVQGCARALVACGEDEKAGALLAKIGRKHQAAELFVKAGALDALEDEYARMAFEEGGTRADARLHFDRFEALWLVAARDEALAALDKACALWSDNPVYAEVQRGVQAALLPPRSVVLSTSQQTLRVEGRWPVVIGRGEGCAVRLDSPLVSRAHLQLELRDGRPYAVDVGAPVVVDGEPLHGARVLAGSCTIALAGVALRVQVRDDALVLAPVAMPERVTLAPFGDVVSAPELRGLRLHLGGRVGGDVVRLDAGPGVTLQGEPLRKVTRLLHGDRIARDGVAFVVTRPPT